MPFLKKIWIILKKIKNFLSLNENKKIYYNAEPKIDGISASLTYKKESFIRDFLEVMEKKEKI